MRIIGIGPEVWIASAVLLENGKVIAGVAEERCNRQKASRKFPHAAIQECLKRANCQIDDVDYIAVGWNPAIHLKSYNYRFSDAARWRAEYLYQIPNNLFKLFPDKDFDFVEQVFRGKKKTHRIMYVTHHLAHAANAYYPSPFKETAILSVDGRGEDTSVFFGIGKDNKIHKLQTLELPHSLGLIYGAVTEFLGFQPHLDEWKVMALASYGRRHNREYKKLKDILKLGKNGLFEFDLSYFSFHLHDKQHLYSPKISELFGEPRTPESPIERRHQQVAAALQQITEEVLIHMLSWLHKHTGRKNLVVGGGVFMNSVFNGKIARLTPFKRVFISSCPDDSGISLGAAAYVHHHILDLPRMEPQLHNFWGPGYADDEIKETVAKYKLPHLHVNDVETYAAKLIDQGNIIGWFQERMEFGQRALGNRSILADPRRPEMRDLVNNVIKYRESFRPFAPSVLEEKVAEYFECNKSDRAPFMEKVFMIRPEKRKLIPAVTHVDGSGRLQTVSKKTNPRYHRLISKFEKITGIPIVLNTSFNLKGEPIVMTPTDAIKTFVSSGLDALIMGNYVLHKHRP